MLDGKKAVLNDLLRDNPAEISAYLTDNLGQNEPERARSALNVVMRAQNVQILARDAGLRRDALYKTFGGRIDPQLGRTLKLLGAMNVAARVVPCSGIDSPDTTAARLSQALARDDPADAIEELSIVVKSQNVSALALTLGIMRTTVYKTFGGTVDPQLSRVLNLFAALRVRLVIEPLLEPKVRPPRPKLGRPRKARHLS